MEKQELYELMDRFARSGLQSLKLRDGEFRLELQRTAVQPAAAPPAAAAAPAAVPAEPSGEPAAPAGELVRSPLVGTYYAAPAPGAEPFVCV